MRADAEPLTPQQSRWLEQVKPGWTRFETLRATTRADLEERRRPGTIRADPAAIAPPPDVE